MSNDLPENQEKLRLSTLPSEERESDSAEWAESQAAIAAVLEVTPKTIQRWLKKDGNPGVDGAGRYHIQKWTEFAVAVGRKTRVPDKAAAELEGIILKNERVRQENEVARGNLLSINDVVELLSSLAAAAGQKLASRHHEVVPSIVGCTVPEGSKRMRISDTKILAELAIGEWAKKKWDRLGFSGRKLLLCSAATSAPRALAMG